MLRDLWVGVYPREPLYNIAPGQVAPVVRQRGAARPQRVKLTWGFRPKWLKPYAGDELEVYPISAYVSKPANAGSEWVARLAEI